MKNREGFLLVTVLMIFTVFFILSIPILYVMVTDKKQSVSESHKIQAYYIARSGAEAAEARIIDMDESEVAALRNSLGIQDKEEEIEEVKVELMFGAETAESKLGAEKLEVILTRGENDSIKIRSKAEVGESIEEVIKVMEESSDNPTKKYSLGYYEK